MPELPDVEVMKGYFERAALGRTIREVRVFGEDMLHGAEPDRLAATLQGDTFTAATRHGKFLFCGLRSGWWLILHFGMTGYLASFSDPGEDPVHDRLRLRLDSGIYLAFVCQRKLGRIELCRDAEGSIRQRRLGADALDETFDFERFQGLMAGRKGSIKNALMNQKLLAGIGNIYADEILFQAAVHPGARVKDLSGKDLRRIHSAMVRVLHTAVECGADPGRMPRSFLLPHRDVDGRCPSCGRGLERITISGRTTLLCPACQ